MEGISMKQWCSQKDGDGGGEGRVGGGS